MNGLYPTSHGKRDIFNRNLFKGKVRKKTRIPRINSHEFLQSHFPKRIGTPTLAYCADQLHLAPNYFGSIMEKATKKHDATLGLQLVISRLFRSIIRGLLLILLNIQTFYGTMLCKVPKFYIALHREARLRPWRTAPTTQSHHPNPKLEATL